MDKVIAAALILCSCAVFVPGEKSASADFLLHYPAAAKVQVVGDWNQWGGLVSASGLVNPSEGLMDHSGEYWEAQLPQGLPRGRYRYAFLVNGHEFLADPLNPETAFFREHRVSVLVID